MLYSEMTEKQQEIFVDKIIPLAKSKILTYYDDLFDEWCNDCTDTDGINYENIYNDFNYLVIEKDYDRLCKLICSNDLID